MRRHTFESPDVIPLLFFEFREFTICEHDLDQDRLLFSLFDGRHLKFSVEESWDCKRRDPGGMPNFGAHDRQVSLTVVGARFDNEIASGIERQRELGGSERQHSQQEGL
jgi:hypothetical protein